MSRPLDFCTNPAAIFVRAGLRQAGSNAIPALTVKWSDGNGKWRKYDMVSTIFLAPALPGSLCSYVANGDAADKTERLHGMIVRLINTNLR